jgi:hypothetical protein
MTLSETLTDYFYQWEERGRGWYLFDAPVRLEPPFAPFMPEALPNKKFVDDGIRPSLLKMAFDGLVSLLSKEPTTPDTPINVSPDTSDTPLCVLAVSLPRDIDLLGYEAEQLLLMLSYCRYPISFELVGTKGLMSIQFACHETDLPYVISQFQTLYPTCSIRRSEDALSPLALGQMDTLMLDLGLKQEFMRPLSFFDRNAPSPYLGLSAIFDTLSPDECACVQVLFQGAVQPWTGSIMRSVMDASGDSFFVDAPEMPKLAEKKVSSQLFAVTVRAVVATRTPERTDEIMNHLAHALMGQTASAYNSLIPLTAPGYEGSDHLHDILARKSRRFGMLLNTNELALLAHVPKDGVLVGRLTRENRKTKPSPEIARGHEHLLGLNIHQGAEKAVSVSPNDRFTHMHVIGATGTGKSTFLLNNIVQDIHNSNGVAVLDPHGDLIESVLACIPRYRMKDVILIDPSDTEYAVGFNILSAHTELEKEVLSSDLVSVFQKLSTSWGDQMSSVLANALLAFLENTEGGTLLDVRRFLIEPPFREKVLRTVTDQSIRYYWQKEFPILKTNSVGSILTRLDAFLRPKSIRYMLGQKKGLDFNEILNGQKILLVKLSHGLIGESNSYLLGSLLVSKIYQTALARQNTLTDARKDFFVYIDEFQHFVTPSLSRILSGGRKYHLGLILAHQSLEQISKYDSELASSLISNAGTRVCFRLGESDAQKLEKGFISFTDEDLMNLGTGEAVCRIGRPDMDFNLKVPKRMPIDSSVFVPMEDVVKDSRERYGVLRSDLEMIFSPGVPVAEEITQTESFEELPKKRNLPINEVSQPEAKKEIQIKLEQEADLESKVIHDPKLVEDIVRRKEESRHKYLQMLIKRNAESRGYKAVIEQATKDGKGRVDVVLQKGKLIYAIEIGITTSKEWECHNIEKCLADGFVNVIALSEDMKGADLMTRKLNECGILPAHAEKIKVYDMTGFMGVLDKEDIGKGAKVKTIKGYRVKVEYGNV